ncbi:DUF3786 domain-containing protein [Desulfonema ishimotonii]|nr:DUF3786 domain-containing protein [Desulfonema ishimotonii]
MSVVDLYRDILPKTNCKECGFSTCLAFASMVVSEKHPLENCPHLDSETVGRCRKELEAQYAAGKWTRRDMAADALGWARERAASMKISDLPDRIGGELLRRDGEDTLKLPYFAGHIYINTQGIVNEDGEAPGRWEQVFIYNHMSQGGRSLPAGNWKALQEIPNTVSKIKSMQAHVEAPLAERFRGRTGELLTAGKALGGRDITGETPSANAALVFRPFPKVPVTLLFWDAEEDDAFDAKVKLLFDETITEHLDIESILFLSERLVQLLCGDEG